MSTAPSEVEKRRDAIAKFVASASRGDVATSIAIQLAAEKFGVTRQTVRNSLKVRGIKTPPHTGGGSSATSPEQCFLIAKLRMYDKLSMAAIAEQVGLTKQRVSVILKAAENVGLLK